MVRVSLTVAFSGESQSRRRKNLVSPVKRAQLIDDEGFQLVCRGRKVTTTLGLDAFIIPTKPKGKLTSVDITLPQKIAVWKAYTSEVGLYSKDCGAGGDCYYKCIADKVYGDAACHPRVRADSIRYLVQHKQEFIHTFVGVEGGNKDHQFYQYIQEHSRIGTYAHSQIIDACLDAHGLIGVFHTVTRDVDKETGIATSPWKATSFCNTNNVNYADANVIHFNYYEIDLHYQRFLYKGNEQPSASITCSSALTISSNTSNLSEEVSQSRAIITDDTAEAGNIANSIRIQGDDQELISAFNKGDSSDGQSSMANHIPLSCLDIVKNRNNGNNNDNSSSSNESDNSNRISSGKCSNSSDNNSNNGGNNNHCNSSGSSVNSIGINDISSSCSDSSNTNSIRIQQVLECSGGSVESNNNNNSSNNNNNNSKNSSCSSDSALLMRKGGKEVAGDQAAGQYAKKNSISISCSNINKTNNSSSSREGNSNSNNNNSSNSGGNNSRRGNNGRTGSGTSGSEGNSDSNGGDHGGNGGDNNNNNSNNNRSSKGSNNRRNSRHNNSDSDSSSSDGVPQLRGSGKEVVGGRAAGQNSSKNNNSSSSSGGSKRNSSSSSSNKINSSSSKRNSNSNNNINNNNVNSSSSSSSSKGNSSSSRSNNDGSMGGGEGGNGGNSVDNGGGNSGNGGGSGGNNSTNSRDTIGVTTHICVPGTCCGLSGPQESNHIGCGRNVWAWCLDGEGFGSVGVCNGCRGNGAQNASGNGSSGGAPATGTRDSFQTRRRTDGNVSAPRGGRGTVSTTGALVGIGSLDAGDKRQSSGYGVTSSSRYNTRSSSSSSVNRGRSIQGGSHSCENWIRDHPGECCSYCPLQDSASTYRCNNGLGQRIVSEGCLEDGEGKWGPCRGCISADIPGEGTTSDTMGHAQESGRNPPTVGSAEGRNRRMVADHMGGSAGDSTDTSSARRGRSPANNSASSSSSVGRGRSSSNGRSGNGQRGRPPPPPREPEADAPPGACPLCTNGQLFSNPASAIKHINRNHKNRSEEEHQQLISVPIMKCYQCTKCRQSFGSASRLSAHVKRRNSSCSDAVLPEGAMVSNMVHSTCLTDAEYDGCCKLLLSPLKSLHPTWTRHIISICHELLGDMIITNNVNKNVMGTQALMLLPGVLEYVRDTKEIVTPTDDETPSPPIMRVVDCLRKITEHPGQAASRILWIAKSVKPPPPRRRRGMRAGDDNERSRTPLSDKASALTMTAKMNITMGKFTIAGKLLEQAEALLQRVETLGEDSGEPESDSLPLDDMIDKIRSLHPTRNSLDDLPPISSDPSLSMTVSRRIVLDVCRGIHSNSCAGADGWEACVLKQIFGNAEDMAQGAGEDDDLIGRLQKVINRITHGLMPKEVRYCLVRLKSVLIPKFDTGGHHIGYRPIGIMGHIARLIHKAVAKAAGFQAKEYLYPMQVAVNTRGGCDIVIAAAQEAFDSGAVIQAQDVKNAYQTIRRSHIDKGILEGCPGASSFFRWTYGDSFPLFDSRGNQFGECETGVPQGDPASMLLFSLGYQPLLKELDGLIKATEADYRSTYPQEPDLPTGGKVIAFADDTIRVTSPQIAFQLVQPTIDLYVRYGLSVHKIYLYGKNVSLLQDKPPDVTLSEEGGLICKSGIGTTPYCLDQLQRKVQSVCIPGRAFHLLPSRYGTAHIKASTNTKLVYHTTTSSNAIQLATIHETAQVFDDRIDDALGAINGFTPNPTNSLVRALPMNAGGLGILNNSGIQLETSRIQSKLRILEWIGDRPEEQNLATITRQQLESITLGAHNQIPSDLDMSTLITMDYKTACATLKKARDKAYNVLAEEHASNLATCPGGGPFAALFRCNQGGPGRQTRAFLRFATSVYSDVDYSDAAFSSLYRFHVAESPLGSANDHLYCKCNSPLPMGHDPSHAWHCKLLQSDFIRRHHGIVRDFRTFFRNVKPGAVTELEPAVGNDRGSYHRADLKIDDGIKLMVLDVVVTDSCNPTSIQHGHTHLDPDASTHHAVHKKQTRYNRTLDANSAVRNCLFPMSVCASGRAGLEARVLIELMGANHKRAKKQLYDNIGRRCGHIGGQMMAKTLSQLTTTPPYMAQIGDPPLPPPPGDDETDEQRANRNNHYSAHLRKVLRRGSTSSASRSRQGATSASSETGDSNRDRSAHHNRSSSSRGGSSSSSSNSNHGNDASDSRNHRNSNDSHGLDRRANTTEQDSVDSSDQDDHDDQSQPMITARHCYFVLRGLLPYTEDAWFDILAYELEEERDIPSRDFLMRILRSFEGEGLLHFTGQGARTMVHFAKGSIARRLERLQQDYPQSYATCEEIFHRRRADSSDDNDTGDDQLPRCQPTDTAVVFYVLMELSRYTNEMAAFDTLAYELSDLIPDRTILLDILNRFSSEGLIEIDDDDNNIITFAKGTIAERLKRLHREHPDEYDEWMEIWQNSDDPTANDVTVERGDGQASTSARNGDHTGDGDDNESDDGLNSEELYMKYAREDATGISGSPRALNQSGSPSPPSHMTDRTNRNQTSSRSPSLPLPSSPSPSASSSSSSSSSSFHGGNSPNYLALMMREDGRSGTPGSMHISNPDQDLLHSPTPDPNIRNQDTGNFGSSFGIGINIGSSFGNGTLHDQNQGPSGVGSNNASVGSGTSNLHGMVLSTGSLPFGDPSTSGRLLRSSSRPSSIPLRQPTGGVSSSSLTATGGRSSTVQACSSNVTNGLDKQGKDNNENRK